MLGRYVTVVRKRTRRCKAPNGVLDNTKFVTRRRARSGPALSDLKWNARIAFDTRLWIRVDVNNSVDALLTRRGWKCIYSRLARDIGHVRVC